MLRFLAGKLRKGGLGRLLVRLHRDEQGAEGVEKLLIIAAIVLPMLGILIYFKDDLVEWVSGLWGGMKSHAGEVTEPDI